MLPLTLPLSLPPSLDLTLCFERDGLLATGRVGMPKPQASNPKPRLGRRKLLIPNSGGWEGGSMCLIPRTADTDVHHERHRELHCRHHLAPHHLSDLFGAILVHLEQ
jgi:hypothetical protein